MRRYETLTTVGKAERHRTTARTALAAYGVVPVRIRRLAVDTNFMFRIDGADGQRYALRVQRPWGVDPRITDLELWFLEALAGRGVPVVQPVRTTDDGLTVTVPPTTLVPEAHRCMLFHWVPGAAADDGDLRFWSRLGELMGSIHAASRSLQLPDGAMTRQWDRVYYFGEDPSVPLADPALTPSMRRVVNAATDALDHELAAIYRSHAAQGDQLLLLHGDLHDGNVRSQRTRLAALDFEDLILGYGVHDVAVSLYGPYFNRPDFAEVAAAMRTGYETHLPWPVTDEAELRTLFAARVTVLIEYCLLMGPDLHEHLPMLVGRLEQYLAR